MHYYSSNRKKNILTYKIKNFLQNIRLLLVYISSEKSQKDPTSISSMRKLSIRTIQKHINKTKTLTNLNELPTFFYSKTKKKVKTSMLLNGYSILHYLDSHHASITIRKRCSAKYIKHRSFFYHLY